MSLEYNRYFIMTLDPVHIGTGGYRLGRVDNAIVREPGTNLPKIPGTSLHGAIRSAAAVRYGEPNAAGQNPKSTNNNSLIMYTFGSGISSTKEERGPTAGAVSIYDARILLFPVASHDGPIWITTKTLLSEACITVSKAPNSKDKAVIYGELKPLGDIEGIALGWLILKAEKSDNRIEPPKGFDSEDGTLNGALNRTVIVHEGIFSELVNSSLEVRTSVAIDPSTGAAEKGGLFTYEAIPRATFLSFDVVVDNYAPGIDLKSHGDGLPKSPGGVVLEGLKLLEYLGVGGMGTRGFGRIKTIGSVLESVTYRLKEE